MSKSKGGSPVLAILAIGFVVVLIMMVGFGGAFLLIKYNHDRAELAAEQQRQHQEQRQRQNEIDESTRTLGAIGSTLGESLGDKVAEKMGESGNAKLLKNAAERLGETLGRELGRSQRSSEFKESVGEIGERLTTELGDRPGEAVRSTESDREAHDGPR